jgi:hypothetical protein
MIWGIPGLKEPAPDVVIVPNIQNKKAGRFCFEVVKEGTRPGLVIEVRPVIPVMTRREWTFQVFRKSCAGTKSQTEIINPLFSAQHLNQASFPKLLNNGKKYGLTKPPTNRRVATSRGGLSVIRLCGQKFCRPKHFIV